MTYAVPRYLWHQAEVESTGSSVSRLVGFRAPFLVNQEASIAVLSCRDVTRMRAGVRTVIYRLVAALIALQSGGACSMALIQRAPPPETRRPYFYCSQEMVLPAADGFVAAFAFANGVYALSKGDADYAGKTLSQGSDLALSAVIAAVFAVSAGVGSRWVAECREASNAAAASAAAVRNPLGPPQRAMPPPADDGPIVAPVDPDPPGDDTPSVR